jgi:hypothetical protein
MTEYSISFHLKIMQNKIPSLHTLAKCAAHAYGYDTFGGGGLLDLECTKAQVMAHDAKKRMIM